MTSSVRGFTAGFFTPLRGIEMFLRKPRVRYLGLIPFLAAAVTMITGFGFALPFFSRHLPQLAESISKAIVSGEGFAATAVYVLALVVAWPAAMFALMYLLFVSSRLIAVPFYALLAERVMIESGLMQDRPFRIGEWLSVSARMLVTSLAKLGVFTIVALALFVLSLIPGLGIFAAFGFLLMAAFDVVDMSFEALQMNLRQRLNAFRKEIWAFSGLALSLGLVFLIPGLNFLLLPASIAGSSEIVRRYRDENKSEKASTR